MNRTIGRAVFGAAILLQCSMFAWGERLVVRVVDQGGAVIPNATVLVRDTPTTMQKGATTDARGEASIDVAPGRYTLWAGASAFFDESMNVDVGAGADTTVSVTLRVGMGGGPEVSCAPRPVPQAVRKLRKTEIAIEVRDRQTDAPVPAAKISLSPANAPCAWSITATTDDSGLAQLSLPNGEYTMKVHSIAYSPRTTTVKVSRKIPEIKTTLDEKTVDEKSPVTR